MDAPETVVDAIRLLREEGYDSEFQLVEGALRRGPDQIVCSVADAQVERLFRFEGMSDPGDEMIVFGVQDPATGTKGYLASGFGPAADPEELDHLSGLASRFLRGRGA